MDNLSEAIQLLAKMRENFQGFLHEYGTFEDVKGLSKYKVSELGFVLNKKTHKLHLPKFMKDGHEHVLVADDTGQRKWVPVRFIVAKTFVNNDDNLLNVEHIDGDKSNNIANNLRWV